MKIQISPIKKVDDALVVWPEETPDTDIVMDPRPPHGLRFKKGSISVIYCFDLFGFARKEDAITILSNMYNLLSENGELYIIDVDFDYVNRAYLGGEIPLKEFNADFRRETYVNQEMLVAWLEDVGFIEKELRVWNGGIKFTKAHYEIVLSAKKVKK
jgi:predicted SAM-dependent methyltransferase